MVTVLGKTGATYPHHDGVTDVRLNCINSYNDNCDIIGTILIYSYDIINGSAHIAAFVVCGAAASASKLQADITIYAKSRDDFSPCAVVATGNCAIHTKRVHLYIYIYNMYYYCHYYKIYIHIYIYYVSRYCNVRYCYKPDM
jgi:hypothetical protein